MRSQIALHLKSLSDCKGEYEKAGCLRGPGVSQEGGRFTRYFTGTEELFALYHARLPQSNLYGNFNYRGSGYQLRTPTEFNMRAMS
jgi:hypothetical protein